MADLTKNELINKKLDLYGDGLGHIALVDYMGTDLDVVNAARHSFNVSHSEMTDADRKLLKYLWDNKHSTPFEHCVIKFSIKVPLYIAKQHMRHRTWSYNEISRRYTSVDISETYCPEKFRKQSLSNRQASTNEEIDPVIGIVVGQESVYETRASDAAGHHIKVSTALYDKLVGAGVCREQARGYLPQAGYTEYIATANLLNVLKFLELRNKPEAQYEMRVLADKMESIVSKIFPEVYAAYTQGRDLSKEKNLLHDYIKNRHPDIYSKFLKDMISARDIKVD
jgi:thymidylate synthase (FAD)